MNESNGDPMKAKQYRTSRCILKSDNEFLLVVHNNYHGVNNGIWGLPGGRIDRGERPVQTARRELYEELTVDVGVLHEVGDWSYKGYSHKVFGTIFDGKIGRVDDYEILEVDWFTLDDVKSLADEDRLHTGFELASIERFNDLLNKLSLSGSSGRRKKGGRRSR